MENRAVMPWATCAKHHIICIDFEKVILPFDILSHVTEWFPVASCFPLSARHPVLVVFFLARNYPSFTILNVSFRGSPSNADFHVFQHVGIASCGHQKLHSNVKILQATD